MPGKKILLLNPPAEDRIITDYYCSKISKGYYYPPPIDLLIQSGILALEFDPVVIDAIIENIPEKECLEKIVRANIEGAISLVGAATFDLNPAYLAKRVLALRTFTELKTHTLEGLCVLQNMFRT